MSFLWNEFIFGPVRSRRLGNSLGINLLSDSKKICTFNCVYCECGWGNNFQKSNIKYVSKDDIVIALEKRLQLIKFDSNEINSITFAGNGEPTLHPEFASIIEEVIRLRNNYCPNVRITCLSNSTTIGDVQIRKALMRIDNAWMKLEAGSEDMYRRINKVFSNFTLKQIVENLIKMEGQIAIQTMFLRGKCDEYEIDNTSDEEISLWIEHLLKIKPKKIILYSIDRETPLNCLEKISKKELDIIAEKLKNHGFEALVY